MIGLRSSGSGFAAIADKMERLARNAPREMSDRAAPAAQAVLAKQYAQECGPNGAKWKPKKRPNGKPQGQASGETMGSAQAMPGPNGDVLLIVEGASSHLQDGTDHMDARPILPSGSLPPMWSEPIDAAAVEGVRAAYEGR